MGKKRDPERHAAKRRLFEESRTIDVTDARAMRFWSRRLGVTETEIAEVVREVGPNTTAVALKLQAPPEERIVPPTIAPR